jgi:hypothetical protein
MIFEERQGLLQDLAGGFFGIDVSIADYSDPQNRPGSAEDE